MSKIQHTLLVVNLIMRHLRFIFIRSVLVLVVAWLASLSSAVSQSAATPQYAPDGRLKVPVGFETWVFVGSNLGLAYKAELTAMTATEATRAAPQLFHNVYINPEAYEHFRRTKTFPEPTILVMEVFSAASKESDILSSGVFNGERRGLEVAVKNTARPDGQTTPWAYYDFTDRQQPSNIREFAPAFPDQVCESCHRQHASIDNVWVQFYPSLRKLLK